jgi:hypothetical protein
MKLVEFSPLTLPGSFHRGLVFNKLWLIHELEKIQNSFSTIYILGSWYGNMSILLARSSIRFDHIVNVDTDKQAMVTGQKIAQYMGIDDKIEPMVKDANTLDYRQLDSSGLLINCSCHDMKNQGWFDNIPPGVMVALQSRDDVNDDLTNYSLSQTLFEGTRQLSDPETEYTSILKIGIK